MKKLLPILLITSLFLSACGMNQTSTAEETGTAQVGGITTYSEMNPVEETTVSKETYGEVTKSNDFEILQTNEETQVIYKGKIIKTWTHTPPKDNPFIWDEACSIVWKKFERINNGDNMEQKKQQTWDSLTLLEKKDCLKESLMSSIKFAKIDNRFIQVQKYGYEGFNGWWIYDTQSGNIQEIMRADGMVKSIEASNTGIKITIENSRGDTQYTILQYDINFASLISQKEL